MILDMGCNNDDSRCYFGGFVDMGLGYGKGVGLA
jgi:hypothetical protein